MKQHKSSRCDVCATPYFERNNYFYGKQFTVRDLFQEQSYLNDKRQLINRMVLGWGVVCGLDLKWHPEIHEFTVESGMAFDCCGHEIIVCETQHVPIDDYEDHCRCAREQPDYHGRFVICLEYEECNAEKIELPAVSCDDEKRVEFNRVRDSFRIRIKKWEDACPKQPYGHIGCLNRYKHDSHHTGEPTSCDTEKIHQYLCRKLKQGCPECEGCDCVILGTFDVKAITPPRLPKDPKQQQQQQQQQGQQGQYKSPPDQTTHEPIEVVPDFCTYRRLVYNNSLLYDLVYCHHGDLPHITDFSWRTHTYPTREVGFDTFLQMMREGLTVYFDKEMTPTSLNPHTFIVSYLYRETGTQTFIEKRIPPKEIRIGKVGDCHTATLIAREDWIRDELDTPNSELRADTRYEPGVSIEITLRGSRIWSTQDKGLDGDYLADKLPTGNGTQGGDFVDWFSVVPTDAKKPKAKPYKDF